MELLDRIDATSAIPKYLQVVNAVIADIEDGILKHGQKVPSINETSEMYYLSRDTIEKAYRELRKRGVVYSVKGKGCYISETATVNKMRILLLFNKLSVYKKAVYYSLLKTLGDDAIIDLHIHHFNGKICNNLIEESLGKYNYYVIMPHFNENSDIALQAIKKIPVDKLVLLDKKLEGYSGECAAVYQDFERDIRNALHSGRDLLSKYDKLTLVYPEDVFYPIEIVKGFRHFCRENAIDHSIINGIVDEQIVEKTAYVVLEESDLTALIKQGRNQRLVLGQDFGIISYNDTPLKEVLADGITVISTEHEKMGETTAYMIRHKLKEKIRNPFILIRRNSL
ncbi:GntR family transcriptional regulator [Pontibacter sp. 172403-2]|uniref:GntR family transcriptional regulator n=1 Tax=Pontibacter rufus TaxID=2791028 RepID=UPI0018AFA985|nr:GntR family transcriptional regulator [Pontibacter sp. 172403-2]MBF9255098.1 GntR family transcriptional regulator [Pontibacter sp. 172403-2]